MPEGTNLGSNFLGSGLTATITYQGGDGNDVSIKLSPGSLFPWHNDAKALDVTNDAHVVASDALQIINYINGYGPGAVPANAVIGFPFGFLDTNQDNFIAPNDVLDVINAINQGLGGEGEAAAPQSFDDLTALLAADTAEQAAHREERPDRRQSTSSGQPANGVCQPDPSPQTSLHPQRQPGRPVALRDQQCSGVPTMTSDQESVNDALYPNP